MTEMYYYTCKKTSIVGRRLLSFLRRAIKADERAEAYAKKFGASSYVQPPQFFAGGVDFLEFDKVPDTKVWRKRITTPDGIDEYEPNCMVRSDIHIVNDERFTPSDTWQRAYLRQRLSWQQVRDKKPLQEWAAIVGYGLTKEHDRDVRHLDTLLSDKCFIPYLEYFGDQPSRDGKAIPQSLRKAIRAEHERQRLPVVDAQELFLLLNMQMDVAYDNKKASPVSVVTPVFFLQGDNFYIGSRMPCKADGLEPTNVVEFNYHKRFAQVYSEKD